MNGILRLGLVIVIWAVTAFVTSMLIPPDWHIFSGYVGGIVAGMILMVD